MQKAVSERLECPVNAATGDLTQFTSALGAAMLGHRRLQKLVRTETEGSPSHVEAA
jgi:hypothetical protein